MPRLSWLILTYGTTVTRGLPAPMEGDAHLDRASFVKSAIDFVSGSAPAPSRCFNLLAPPSAAARRLDHDDIAPSEAHRELRGQRTPATAVDEPVPPGPPVRAAVRTSRPESTALRDDRHRGVGSEHTDRAADPVSPAESAGASGP